MALIIDLKPGEKILVGEAVIINDDQRTRLHISGDAPIMREKDIMQEETADTPCKKIYFLVQCMYLARDPKEYFNRYFNLIRDIQDAAPTTSLFFMKINDMILVGKYYMALKEAKELLKHEEELIANVTRQQEPASS
jgi:flagellar biosynthesis repressor protein FlbT